MEKICSNCKLKKDESEFSFKNKKTNLRHSRCKICKREYGKEYYNKNREYHAKKALEFNNKYKDVFRKNMVEYLRTHPCVDCGESDIRVLEFDHVRGNKKYDVSRMIHHSWTNVLNEIDKCEIRCANCHRKKTVDLAYRKLI